MGEEISIHVKVARTHYKDMNKKYKSLKMDILLL